MPTNSDNLHNILSKINEQFNFNKYEADAYFTTLNCGRATASEIAERADIPQPRIYDILRNLEERQLIELRETRPLQAVAINPVETFGDIHSPVKDFLTKLEAQYTSPAEETNAATLIKSRETVERHIEQIIKSAEYELVLSITPQLLRQFKSQLTAQQRANVTTDLLVTPSLVAPDPNDYDYRSIATRVRIRRGVTTPIIAVADGNHSLYTTQDYTNNVNWNQYGVVFNRSSLGFLLSAFFDTILWTTSEVLLADDNDQMFPQEYASVRRCVKDIQHHDDELYASVEGREVETGIPRTIAGAIVGSTSEDRNQIASITIDTDDEVLEIGGRIASLEDIEAHKLTLHSSEK